MFSKLPAGTTYSVTESGAINAGGSAYIAQYEIRDENGGASIVQDRGHNSNAYALRDIFVPMLEAKLQGEMDSHLGYESNNRGSKSTFNEIGTAALSRSKSPNEPRMSFEAEMWGTKIAPWGNLCKKAAGERKNII